MIKSLKLVILIPLLVSLLLANDEAGGSAAIAPPEQWANLTNSEKKMLREAIQHIWNDPELLSARNDVNQATEMYKQLLREKVIEHDPEAESSLEKVHGVVAVGPFRKRESTLKRVLRSIDDGMVAPHLIRKMSPDQKERFLEAANKARNTKLVQQSIKQLMELNQDEGLRLKKVEAVRNYRRAFYKAVIELEPEFEKFLPVGSVRQ